MTTLRVGTRGSALALAQARAILAELQARRADVQFEEVIIKTTGDRWSEKNQGPLPSGKGIFTMEIERAVLEGTIDCAVHSLKDLPTEMRPDLCLGAIPARADARDVLVTKGPITLEELPQDATVATGSLRRRQQLLRLRKDLQCVDIRGNIDTRLRKLRENDDWSATLLAAAGLERLGPELGGLHAVPLETTAMLPAPGQGALALQARAADEAVADVLSAVHDIPTAAAVTAERGFLAATGGGCQWPLGACARMDDSLLHLAGIFWVEGEAEPREGKVNGPIEQPEELGRQLAKKLLL